MMKRVSLTSCCNIKTGKLDSNAAVSNGQYPYFTCAPEPLLIDHYAYDDNVILLAGNNASGNFHCRRFTGKFNAYQRTYVISAKPGYDIDYLFYNIKLNLKHFRKISQGSQTKFLTMKMLNSFTIPNIPFDEQVELVKILVHLDEKIELNKKINHELFKISNKLYDYWFIQFDFPNEEGEPYKSSGGKMVWNDDIKGEIPEGWEARQIGDILIVADKSKIQVNGAKKKGDFPFFTSGESILAYHEFLVDGFNILLNTGGNPDIKAYKGKCAFSTDTWCISAKQYSYILYHYLLKLMPQFEQLFFAGSGLKHLQKDVLKSKFIVLPDNKVLKSFNLSCSSIWERISNCSIQNLELTSLRDFLLPMLMNGQVTFR